MKLFLPLTVLAAMVFGTVVVQYLNDTYHWHLPWYFIQQIVVGVIPMAWLLYETLPKADRADRFAFLTSSAIFISLSAIFELIAIQERYWWFYQGIDHLTGFRVGDIPLEEFFFYPMFLNLPMLFYWYLKQFVTPTPAPKPLSPVMTRVLQGAGVLFGLVTLGLIGWALTHSQPPLDPSIQPAPDAAGAIRYTAGPPDHGWTIVQMAALSSICFFWIPMRERIDRRRFAITVAVYFVLAFFFELMGCGRGWWVWNSQQVMGVFTWVLPIESYAMYVTGAVMPIITLEWLKPFFAQSTEKSPSVALT